MKKIIFALICFLSLNSPVIAGPLAPTSIKLDSSTDTSANFSWTSSPTTAGGIGYYLYWGTKPGIDGIYENEEVTPIDGTSYELKGLKKGTKYFLALSSLDKEGEESPLSQEFSFSLDSVQGVSSSFALNEVKSKGLSELELIFSRDLENISGAQREFVIKSSSGDEISVVSTEIGNKKNTLQVFLGKDMKYTTSYQVTVLAIKDATGKTIENGIDAVTEFSTPGSFDVPEIELNSAGPQEALAQSGTFQTSLSGSQNMTLSAGSAGKIISNQEVDKYTIVAAKQNDDLPKTGPGFIFIALLALTSGGFYFYYTKSPKNS